MAYKIEESVKINAPRQLVWDIAQNPERRTEWDARVVSAEILSQGPAGKGAIVQVTVKMYGMKFRTVMEYVSWSAPVRTGVKGLDGYGNFSHVVGSWNFQEHDDGSMTFKTNITISMEKGLFAGIIERNLGRTFHKLTQQSLQNLKRLAEAECAMRIRHEAAVLI